MSKKSPFNYSGVYKITCLPTQEIYIGGSKSISRRWSTHKVKLRKGYHENHLLQSRFYDYGEHSLSFEVLEKLEGLSKEEIKVIESSYIQKLNSDLNIITEPNLCWDITGSKNPMSKMSEEDVYLIKCCYSQYMNSKEIKKHLNLPYTCSAISDACSELHWKHVTVHQRDLVIYEVITPDKEVITMNYLQDLKRRITISPHHLFRIASSFKDLYFHDYRCNILHLPKLELIKNPKLLTCTNQIYDFWGFLKDPDGICHEVWAFKQFCKKHNLDMNSIARVARGEWTHHKGWTIPVS